MIGRMLVLGIPGKKVRARDVRLFRDTRAGGLILYRRNFESPRQLRRLVSGLEEALERRLLIFLDHEGGRVVMFREGVTVFPDALAFGAGGCERDVRRQGAVEARELRRLGVDVNLAPVMDVLTEGYSASVGIRSYGMDERRVTRLAVARLKAMQKAGLSACAKHFPGLGPARLDPHLDLPRIPFTWAQMRRVHLRPFAGAVAAGVDLVMSSHPLYPRLDSAPRTPATFSARLIRGCLRGELGYQGIISTDDLEMGAIRRLCPPGRAAVMAVKAGHDLLLSCREERFQREIFASLLESVLAGDIAVRDLEKSVERIEAVRKKHSVRYAPGAPRASPAGASLARRVSENAVRVCATTSARFPRRLSDLIRLPRARFDRHGVAGSLSSVYIVFPRLSAFAKTVMLEKPLEKPAAYLSRRLRRVRSSVRIGVVPVLPRRREIRSIGKRARAYEGTVFFCQDAHLYPGLRRLLNDLHKASKKFILVLLRNPYDVKWVPPHATVVTAFGYRLCQIEACLKSLFGMRGRALE